MARNRGVWWGCPPTLVLSTSRQNRVELEALLKLHNFPEFDLDYSKFVNQVIECALGPKKEGDQGPNFESARRDFPNPDAILKRNTVIYLTQENKELLQTFVNAWIQRNPESDYSVNNLLNFLVSKALKYIAKNPPKP